MIFFSVSLCLRMNSGRKKVFPFSLSLPFALPPPFRHLFIPSDHHVIKCRNQNSAAVNRGNVRDTLSNSCMECLILFRSTCTAVQRSYSLSCYTSSCLRLSFRPIHYVSVRLSFLSPSLTLSLWSELYVCLSDPGTRSNGDRREVVKEVRIRRVRDAKGNSFALFLSMSYTRRCDAWRTRSKVHAKVVR